MSELGFCNLVVVANFVKRDVLIKHLQDTFGFNNVSSKMLADGVPFLLEKEKHHLVESSNDTHGQSFLLRLEPVGDL